jgi:signal transduction histidine kinase
MTSNHIDVRGAWAAVAIFVGWGWIGTGLFTWSLRPDSSVGPLMTATGFFWFVSLMGASNLPALFIASAVLSSVYFVTAIHMLLTASHSQGLSRGDRRIIIVGYILVTVGTLPLALFFDPSEQCENCPPNPILVADDQTFFNIWNTLISLIGLAVIVAVLRSLVLRWRRATRPERRLYAPVYAAGVALMIAVIAQLGLQTSGSEGTALDIVFIVGVIPFGLVPYLFLASFVRTRMAQGGAVGELMARLSDASRAGGLRDALADALDDPSLELVYWLPEGQRYVDFRGREYTIPEDDEHRAVHYVDRDGDCVAAIIYDATLRGAEPHVQAVGGAASLALHSERLDAELRAKIDELRGSRERMLRIGLEERRRLERDLHDGAQQRLVSMALNIRLARAKLNEDPLAADQLLESAGHEPVELAELPEERLPEAVELAAYFVVAEALTNVAKYANASHATVEMTRENGRLVVEVADDGIGGADPENGTGLRGLADRIAVLEGRLEIDSERGKGTTVRARIPCA